MKAGEAIDMPVVFFVDPDIDKDPNLASIQTITLSYTFFPKERDEALLQEIEVETKENGDG